MRNPSPLDSRVKFASEGQRLRVFQRANIAGEVLIHDERQLFIAPLENISASGLFVDQLVTLPVGSQVRIVVRSTKFATPVQATGTVVRVESENRQGCAVEFTSISSRCREVIQNYVFEARMEQALRVA